MLTLDSRRFPVLGEVSFCVIAKETQQGVTITLFICSVIYKFVTTNTLNCHGTIALIDGSLSFPV